tara:strand:- start:1600 stop:1836 length:237 start_codon:yes stop_codon:yes gene_type:complete
MKKITEEQLKEVKDQQNKLSNFLTKIGILEIQKQEVASQVEVLSKEIEKTKSDLENQYGAINIDLKDGSYTEIKKDAE